MDQKNLIAALTSAQGTLELIAARQRPDGTYNRDREACGVLARDTLKIITALLNPVAAPGAESGAEAQPVGSASGKFVVVGDGGSRGNPGPSGWGVVVLEDDVVRFAGGGFIGVQTNQVAELTAAIEGLSRVPEGARVELVSDSQYTLKGLTEWRAGWERNGWRTASKEPVKNLELWKRLYALADKRKVTTRWVKGHSGDVLNERADSLANQAMDTREPLVLETV
jgi:ribonuclease HI